VTCCTCHQPCEQAASPGRWLHELQFQGSQRYRQLQEPPWQPHFSSWLRSVMAMGATLMDRSAGGFRAGQDRQVELSEQLETRRQVELAAPLASYQLAHGMQCWATQGQAAHSRGAHNRTPQGTEDSHGRTQHAVRKSMQRWAEQDQAPNNEQPHHSKFNVGDSHSVIAALSTPSQRPGSQRFTSTSPSVRRP